VFCQDVAASGGYWLATAGDEIYADENSIIGSIGVIAAGFGFVEAIKKLGIERRLYTQGENKSILDPFAPEKKEDVDRLMSLQGQIHKSFIDLVKSRRGAKLNDLDGDMFTGAFWTGDKALEMGLIDGLGSMHDILERKFGPDVEVKQFERSTGLLGKFGLGQARIGNLVDGLGDEIIEAAQTRSLWQRFGL